MYPGAFLFRKLLPGMLESERRRIMEFVTGVKKKETLELSELLEEGRIGAEVKVNGAIHTIRDMGIIAFIILRKREGLVQCVYDMCAYRGCESSEWD